MKKWNPQVSTIRDLCNHSIDYYVARRIDNIILRAFSIP